jgi:hypothetical protein
LRCGLRGWPHDRPRKVRAQETKRPGPRPAAPGVSAGADTESTARILEGPRARRNADGHRQDLRRVAHNDHAIGGTQAPRRPLIAIEIDRVRDLRARLVGISGAGRAVRADRAALTPRARNGLLHRAKSTQGSGNGAAIGVRSWCLRPHARTRHDAEERFNSRSSNK